MPCCRHSACWRWRRKQGRWSGLKLGCTPAWPHSVQQDRWQLWCAVYHSPAERLQPGCDTSTCPRVARYEVLAHKLHAHMSKAAGRLAFSTCAYAPHRVSVVTRKLTWLLTVHSWAQLLVSVQPKAFAIAHLPISGACSSCFCLTGHTASVVKRWNGSVQMSWRMTSKLWDRLAHRNHAVAKVPVLNVDISAAALLIHLDAASLRTVLGLTASVLHFFQYRDYRRLRPQASFHWMPCCIHHT